MCRACAARRLPELRWEPDTAADPAAGEAAQGPGLDGAQTTAGRLRRCDVRSQQMSDDERAIRDLIGTWFAASKGGDLNTVLGLMSDDMIFMVPGRSFGKAEFRTASEGMKGMAFEAVSNVLEVQVAGDHAWCRTHLTVTVTPPNGSPVRRSGNTLSILQKQPDGKWMMIRDANMLA
jgi:uncharacterized protein (TIGR02246 family)